MSFGHKPWQQQNWDWRAACNFMCGGAGSGLIVFAALADASRWVMLAGLVLIGLGLLAVWAEIGRPWRALNVFINPRTSWMTREAIVAPVLVIGVAAAWGGVPGAAWLAAILALAFVYCQARILQAARGIPAWREPSLVPLVVLTGLAEGAGLLVLLAGIATWPLPRAVWAAFAILLLARLVLWVVWRGRVRTAARALAAIDSAGQVFKACSLLPLAAVALALGVPQAAPGLLHLLAGLLALAGGAWFKYTLVTRAAYNQGFALASLPVRGAPRN